MDAVAGHRALDHAAVSEVDRDLRDGADGLPVEDEPLAQRPRHLAVGVEDGAEEPAVRAAAVLVEPPEQAQREHGLPARLRLCERRREVLVPEETRETRVLLACDGVHRGRQPARRLVCRGVPGGVQGL